MALGVSFRPIIPIHIPLPSPQQAQEAINRTRTWAQKVHQTVAAYPPQLPTVSGYIRSGTLGRNWEVENTLEGAQVDNEVTYADFVQGPGQTAEMSRRMWRTLIQVTDEQLPDLEASVRAILERAR